MYWPWGSHCLLLLTGGKVECKICIVIYCMNRKKMVVWGFEKGHFFRKPCHDRGLEPAKS